MIRRIACVYLFAALGAEVLIVDLRARRLLDHLYVSAPAVSPDGRFILYERANARGDEEDLGSTVLLYDVSGSAQENRMASAIHRGRDVGVAVYPENLKQARSYGSTQAGLQGGRLISVTPVWATSKTVLFGYEADWQIRFVALSLNQDGSVERVRERLLDPDTYLVPGPEPARARFRIEEIKVIQASEAGIDVRLRIGPAHDARIRWLDLHVA